MNGSPDLRDYQVELVNEFHSRVAAGDRRILAVMPTGSGKTIVASSIIRTAARNRKSVLVLAHRREIIAQTSQKLFAYSVPHGIIQAGFQPRPLENVQVASIQTLWRRSLKSALPPADLLMIDEGHHCPALTYGRIIARYPDAILLGLTATPCRGDGRGLGGIFQRLIEGPQVADLIKAGWLVRTRVYAPVDLPDLAGVRTRGGDYVEEQLAERMDRPKLVGDLTTHWHRFGERRRTVVFACTVGHSVHIKDEFIRSGVRAEHIDGSTPKAERDASLARLASGEIDVVTNCMVLTEGWDLPAIGCCVLARPTRQMGLYAR
jgi:DNA repair protein RadD